MESTAIGLLSGILAYRYANKMATPVPPPTTAIGALVHYITHSLTFPFQPMNINFGLFPPFPGRSKGKGKRLLLAKRALGELEEWKKKVEG
jgi:methylenetetrahydrofolate--tRNA-(uracil-5-)-methyltransferase